MIDRKDAQRAITLLALVVFWIIALAAIGSHELAPQSIKTLDSGWTVKINSQPVGENVRLDEVLSIQAHDGDTAEFTRVLGNNVIAHRAIQIYSCHAQVFAYLDDTLIYHYGDGAFLETHTFLPQGYHCIALPEGSEGKRLTLRYVAQRPNAFSVIRAPIEGNIQDLRTNRASLSLPDIAMGVFLLLFGFLMGATSVAQPTQAREVRGRIATSFVSMSAGLLILTYFDSFFFVTGNIWVTTYLEYLSQCLVIISLLAYMAIAELPSLAHRMAQFGTVFFTVLSAICILLDVTYIVPFDISVSYAHIALVPVLIAFIIAAAASIVRKKRADKQNGDTPAASKLDTTAAFAIRIGVASLLISVVTQVAVYVVFKYNYPIHAFFQNVHPLTIGCTLFIVAMTVSYYLQDLQATNESDRAQRLVALADTDALTGLYNRGFCDRVLQKLTEEKRDYALFVMDVNGLKITNDTKGHSAGDDVIRRTAEVIQSGFRARDVVGRYGGDEFIALVVGMTKSQADARLKEISAEFKRTSRRLGRPDLSVAAGYACSTETDDVSYEQVFKIADERMYEMKTQMKKAAARG